MPGLDDLGILIALLVALGSTYEFVALLHPRLPTISRVVQGWRDSGGAKAVLALTLFCVTALGVFGAWLWHHFLHERRSNL